MTLEKLMFMPDTHFPYHDEAAFQVFLNAAEVFRPDHLFILGDCLDFYSVSSHDKDPRRRERLEEEVEQGNELLDRIETLGVSHVVFCAGNHEFRLDRYLMKKAPELFGLVGTEDLLQLQERGWDYVPYRQCIKVGHLYVTHDVGFSGPRVTQQTYSATGANVVVGHAHRMQWMVARDLMGSSHVVMCPGWLGSFEKVDYMHNARLKDWSHGFGVGYLDVETGNVHDVHATAIVDDQCVVEGKLVKA